MPENYLEDNPDRVEDDFDGYLEDYLTEVEKLEIVDEASAKEKALRALSRDVSLQSWVTLAGDRDHEFLVKNSPLLQGLIKENAKLVKPREQLLGSKIDAQGRALRFENRRSRRARLVDESATAKQVFSVTPENVRRWSRKPGRSDLRGIDTKRSASRAGRRRYFTPRRTNKYVRLVRSRLKRDGSVLQWYQFRDVKTGKFLKKK